MSPTALSQLTEQIVKLGAGLLFVKFLMPDAANAAAGAALAVTFSEAAALFQLVVTYRIYRKKGAFLPLAPLACAAGKRCRPRRNDLRLQNRVFGGTSRGF